METARTRAIQAPELLSALLATATAGVEPGGIELPGFLAQAAEGVLVVATADGEVWAANEAAYGLLGRTALVGKPLAEVLGSTSLATGQTGATLRLPIVRALEGEMVADVELSIRRPEGDEILALASASPIRTSGGQVVGALVTFRSIARLRDAEKLGEELTELLVHEARGVLTAILGRVGLLEALAGEPVGPHGDPRHSGQRTRLLGAIRADVWRLNTLLDELLDVARIAAHDVRLNKQPLDLVALIDSLIDRLSTNGGVPLAGRWIRAGQRGPIPLVEADPARVEQILVSALTAVASCLPTGAGMVVLIEPGPDDVVVSVSGRAGSGWKDALSPLLDRRLLREDLLPERWGLGPRLQVARALAEAHGGRLWAEHDQRQGVTLCLALPLAPSPSGAANQRP